MAVPLPIINIAICMLIPNMTVDYVKIINKIRDMVTNSSAASYLPAEHKFDRR